MRSSGSIASSAMVSVRGSMCPRARRPRRGRPASGRPRSRRELERAGAVGRPRRAPRAPRPAPGPSRRASAMTPTSTARWAPIASSSRSTCTTRVPAPTSAPWRVVHMFSVAPKASTTSACASSSRRGRRGEAAGDSDARRGRPRTGRWPTAEVARIAPLSSPRVRSAGPAPARTAPRPAMIAGLRPRPEVGDAARPPRPGAGGASVGAGAGAPSSGAGAACTSRGSMSATVRRSTRARRTARATSARAVAGPWTRSATAPTDSTSASWSMRKFERSAAGGVSAASRSSGVRLLAASVKPGDRVGEPRALVHAGAPAPLTRA